MPDLPLELSRILERDPSTIRRWLRQGYVPGAYRTKGGHWRIRNMSMKTLVQIEENVRARTKRPFAQPSWVKNFVRQFREVISPEVLRAQKRFLTAHGLTNETIVTEKEGLAPELRKQIFEMPIFEALSPNFLGAARRPYAELHLVAQIIANRIGTRPTAKMIAQEMGISRNTLYKRYFAPNIKMAIIHSSPGGELAEETGERPTIRI